MAIFEQDFIMRQVRYLTQLLQEIVFKKNSNKQQEAIREIKNAFQRLTKDHPKKLHELSPEETLALFTHRDEFQSDLAMPVADLLMEEAEMLGSKRYSKSQKAYQQALLLYKHTGSISSAAIPIDLADKISAAKDSIADSDAVNHIHQLAGKNDQLDQTRSNSS